MQGMMQSLLSAEVLLPSLKEMLEKYPAWLDENKDKISDADKERYTKQQELFKVICTELEKETPNDSTEVKNERFKIVLKNMQKVCPCASKTINAQSIQNQLQFFSLLFTVK